jgi:hypothetical protein
MARQTCEIEINATSTGNGQFTFTMAGDGVEQNGSHGQKLVFDKRHGMHKHDDHKIVFKLARGRSQIRFTRNLANVLWVAKVASATDPCPSNSAHIPGEFFAYKVNDDQDELSIINTNMARELLAFRLNFVPKGQDDISSGQQYIAYDPITDNRDGGLQIAIGGGNG